MKLSAYHKQKGDVVRLLHKYENIPKYDLVYISKAFTDTPVPDDVLSLPNVKYGGTGFYFDKAEPLPYEIENIMPDYDLYKRWVDKAISEGAGRNQFRWYLDYSIGFTTRGCFRKCGFCVNQKYNRVFKASDLDRFVDVSRKKICLLDDNFLGYAGWEYILGKLKSYNKPIVFKQGLDVRLLTDAKCKELFTIKYDGEYIFAFDDYKDYEIMESKLQLIRQYTDKGIMFYVLVGYKDIGVRDIEEMFLRIELLFKYRALPYVMKYRTNGIAPWERSEYKGLYTAVANWINQPTFCKKLTFREFCEVSQKEIKGNKLCSRKRALIEFEKNYPEIAKRFFDMRFGEVKE